MRAFKSVLLPLKAVILNLVSLGAAYGIIVFIFQKGHGAEEIWNVPATDSIISWIPLMIFAFLYGLSMDYEVFMLTRIRGGLRRRAHGPGDRARAGANGQARDERRARLMFSFSSSPRGPGTDISSSGLACGGIIFDATVIRALLVPSIMRLIGDWNWWIPAAAGADPAGGAKLGLSRVLAGMRRCASRARELDAADFDRAVALVSVEASPRALVDGSGSTGTTSAGSPVDASATAFGERAEDRGAVIWYGGEAFTGGFLIGVHVREEPRLKAGLWRPRWTHAGAGRHTMMADHSDLAERRTAGHRISDPLVESMAVAEEESEALRSPVTRIFEAGLAVGSSSAPATTATLGSERPCACSSTRSTSPGQEPARTPLPARRTCRQYSATPCGMGLPAVTRWRIGGRSQSFLTSRQDLLSPIRSLAPT